MIVTVVGSGTVVPQGERACSGYFVETDDLRILMDCGSGVVRNLARFGLPWPRITHVLISHFHTDHVGDLPSLLFSLRHGLATPRVEPLTVIGPVGTGELLRRMAGAFGDYVTDPGFPLHVRELEPGATLELDDAVRLACRATPHTGESLAYRLESADRAVGYSGDTGMDAGLSEFFRGTDVLIIECSLPDALAMDTHLTPGRVARIAAAAAPRQLVLTHLYPQVEVRDLPDRLAGAGWTGGAAVAADGTRFVV